MRSFFVGTLQRLLQGARVTPFADSLDVNFLGELLPRRPITWGTSWCQRQSTAKLVVGRTLLVNYISRALRVMATGARTIGWIACVTFWKGLDVAMDTLLTRYPVPRP